jgi:transporter family protein
MNAVWLAVLAGACWGVGELCTKMVLHTHRIGPVTAIALRSTIALPVLWLAFLLIVQVGGAEPRSGWRSLETADWLKLVLGSGLVAGAGGMICFYAALNLGDISHIKPIAFTLAPAVAVVLGWMLLGEPMTMRKGIAVAMILSGVLLLTGGGAKTPAARAHAEVAPGPEAPR